MSNPIKPVSDASFDADVLQSGTPVLLDFWAPWCGPCKMIAKVLEDVAKEYGDRLQIAKINIDENQLIPAQFGVRGIPTLILFKNGAMIAQKVGALSKPQLTAFLDSHL
jgi:thioredoxin 1